MDSLDNDEFLKVVEQENDQLEQEIERILNQKLNSEETPQKNPPKQIRLSPQAFSSSKKPRPAKPIEESKDDIGASLLNQGRGSHDPEKVRFEELMMKEIKESHELNQEPDI